MDYIDANDTFELKWGFAGSGLITHDFCTALQHAKHPLHKMVAVADERCPADAQRHAEKFNMPIHFGSYDDLVNCNEINIVHVGVINTMHHDLCLKAIAAGKHILCEKPMSMCPREQEEVFAAAKAKGVFFMEGLWSRFFPCMKQIRKEIADNEIGEVKTLNVMFSTPIAHKPRLRNKELGGGALLDIGCYCASFLNDIFNNEKPEKIVATGHLMDTGVDECVNVTLLYSRQRIASILLSTNSAMVGMAYVVGTKGFIHVPQFVWCPIEYSVDYKREVKTPLPELSTHFYYSVGFKFEAEDVRQAISKGLKEHPLLTHEMSRRSLYILDEAKRQLGYITE